jgi:hypothetical protein
VGGGVESAGVQFKTGTVNRLALAVMLWKGSLPKREVCGVAEWQQGSVAPGCNEQERQQRAGQQDCVLVCLDAQGGGRGECWFVRMSLLNG